MNIAILVTSIGSTVVVAYVVEDVPANLKCEMCQEPQMVSVARMVKVMKVNGRQASRFKAGKRRSIEKDASSLLLRRYARTFCGNPDCDS